MLGFGAGLPYVAVHLIDNVHGFPAKWAFNGVHWVITPLVVFRGSPDRVRLEVNGKTGNQRGRLSWSADVACPDCARLAQSLNEAGVLGSAVAACEGHCRATRRVDARRA